MSTSDSAQGADPLLPRHAEVLHPSGNSAHLVPLSDADLSRLRTAWWAAVWRIVFGAGVSISAVVLVLMTVFDPGRVSGDWPLLAIFGMFFIAGLGLIVVSVPEMSQAEMPADGLKRVLRTRWQALHVFGAPKGTKSYLVELEGQPCMSLRMLFGVLEGFDSLDAILPGTPVEVHLTRSEPQVCLLIRPLQVQPDD